jgi:hypothetical protein
MKIVTATRYTLLFLLIALSGMTLPGYAAESADQATTEDIKQETRELLQALKAYSVDQRDEAVEQARGALDKLDQRIDTLENHAREHWDEMDQAARDKASASLQALREQRTLVAEWYGSLKNSSGNVWGHVKQGFSTAYEALHEAWKKSEQEISSDEGK